MTQGIQSDLYAFATALLERRGGLVEWSAPSADGVAILTPDMAEVLQSDETVHLSCQPGVDGLCANLASDFLEQSAALLQAESRIGVFHVPELYLKQGSMDGPIGQTFTWLNAKVKVGDASQVRAQYHTWWFFASVVSDDRWEQLVPVTINAHSGAEIDFFDPLGVWDLQPLSGGSVEGDRTYQQAVQRARVHVRKAAADFICRLDARLERDRKRVRGYYKALVQEVKGKDRRTRTETDQAKAETRQRAVHLELRRKLAELEERYAMQIALTPVMLVSTDLPVLSISCEVFRKRARSIHTIYWNPVLKELEPLRCHQCGTGSFVVAFTDTDVYPLCKDCANTRNK